MAIAIDPKTPISVITESDMKLPEGERTVFKFLPFTRRELSRFAALKDQVEGNKQDAVQGFIEILKDKLVGWSNFRLADGTPVEFLPSDMERNFDMIGLGTLVDLFQKIMDANQLNVEQLKN